MKLKGDITSSKHVLTSPGELRMIADLIEAKQKASEPGDKISVITEDGFMLIYNPLTKSAAATGLLQPYSSFEGKGGSPVKEQPLKAMMS